MNREVDRSQFIAIHSGKTGWNPLWVDYCKRMSIPHKVVDCLNTEILGDLDDCWGLIWHFEHFRWREATFARSLLNAVEMLGKVVYPNCKTNWHFDDKLAQKYLFEAMGISCPKTWVFFDCGAAQEFAKTCILPVVAKLRKGASSANVRLITSRRELMSYIASMFSKGLPPIAKFFNDAKTKIRVSRASAANESTYRWLLKMPKAMLALRRLRNEFENERGYVYLQEYIPGNGCDYRLIVVDDRCWGYKRFVRPGDFRASGSHLQDQSAGSIPVDLVNLGFQYARLLQMQSAALDFVIAGDGKPLMCEASYCFGYEEGDSDWYYDRELVLHKGSFQPWDVIVESMIRRRKVTDGKNVMGPLDRS